MFIPYDDAPRCDLLAAWKRADHELNNAAHIAAGALLNLMDAKDPFVRRIHRKRAKEVAAAYSRARDARDAAFDAYMKREGAP